VPTAGGRERAILDAVFDLFFERGYAGFSMGEVATRAGVPEERVTRIGGRAELVTAAVNHRVPPMPECPDMGSLRGDLVELARLQIAYHRQHGREVEHCLKAISQSAEFASAARPVTLQRIEVYRPMFDRAIARGDIERGFLYEEFVDLLSAPLLGRLFAGRPLDEDAIEEGVDLIVQGLRERQPS